MSLIFIVSFLEIEMQLKSFKNVIKCNFFFFLGSGRDRGSIPRLGTSFFFDSDFIQSNINRFSVKNAIECD